MFQEKYQVKECLYSIKECFLCLETLKHRFFTFSALIIHG